VWRFDVLPSPFFPPTLTQGNPFHTYSPLPLPFFLEMSGGEVFPSCGVRVFTIFLFFRRKGRPLSRCRDKVFFSSLPLLGARDKKKGAPEFSLFFGDRWFLTPWAPSLQVGGCSSSAGTPFHLVTPFSRSRCPTKKRSLLPGLFPFSLPPSLF